MGRYQTEQKKLLIAFLAEHKNRQFSAEELSELLNCSSAEDREETEKPEENEESKKQKENRGKAPGKSTVYRLVTELTEDGTLRRFPKSGGRGWTYQYHRMNDCSGHLHLKCEKCGTLLHLDCSLGDELLSHIEEEHGFLVDNQETVLFGLCAACRSLPQKKKRISCEGHQHNTEKNERKDQKKP